jgi:hypothetical protein
MREWAHDCLAEVRESCRAGWKAIDRPIERWFCGRCDEELTGDDGHPVTCGAAMYALADRPEVHCPGCGATYDVIERRAWLISAADDRLETAATISRALTKLGREVTIKAICQWRTRGQLEQAGNNIKGQPLYRLGDVAFLASGQRVETRRKVG